VPPPHDPPLAPASPSALLDRLESLAPRSASLLEQVLLAGAPLSQVAELRGVGPDAIAVAFLRAVRELRGAPPSKDEAAAARALRAALDGGEPPPAPTPDLLALRPYREAAPALRALAGERRRLRARRDDRLRPLAAVALIALALWLSR
jgi:hypothetical protein